MIFVELLLLIQFALQHRLYIASATSKTNGKINAISLIFDTCTTTFCMLNIRAENCFTIITHFDNILYVKM